MTRNLHVSIVIPVYNEVDQIHACLDALTNQTVAPLEVIVVDNNSTDGTAAIARAFPFVTVLTETRQGVVYARDRGFNESKGDIIARIDADTIVDPDWIDVLQQKFANPELDLVTGSVRVRGIGAARLASKVDLFWRRRMHRQLGSQVALQGASMALRRKVWRTIKSDVCHERGIHEDFDLGLHANQSGFKAAFVEELQVSVCHRQLDAGFRRFADYALTSPRTYLKHGVRRGRVMYKVVAFVILLYPLIYVLSRGYDADQERFSLSKLFSDNLPTRVNPATFLD